MKNITSIHNPIVKNILLLQEKSKTRKESGLFIIDGLKESLMALENGYTLETIFFSESHLDKSEQDIILKISDEKDIQLVRVSTEVFSKMAYRGSSSKIVSVAKNKTILLSDISCKNSALFIVLDGVEKPGNLGAILRIADAAGIDAVLCSDIHTDIFNPNVIRSSVGCVFSQKICCATKEEILGYFQSNKIQIFTTSLKAAKDYLDVDYAAASAFVFGTEAEGVQTFWEENATQNILITMRGQNDSLNVSNTVAIVVFEALRQRGQ